MFLKGIKRTIQVHKPRKELVVPDPASAEVIEGANEQPLVAPEAPMVESPVQA